MTRQGSEYFTDREISALHQENTGPPYARISVIKERVLEAKIEAALIPSDICKFNNEWGWCKLDAGHEGSHTVIFLGKDD